MAAKISALQQELASAFRENADAEIQYDEGTSAIRMRLRELEMEREHLQTSLNALRQARLVQKHEHSEKIESIERQLIEARVEQSIPNPVSAQTDDQEPAHVQTNNQEAARVQMDSQESTIVGGSNEKPPAVAIGSTANAPVEIEDDDFDDVELSESQEHVSEAVVEQRHLFPSTSPRRRLSAKEKRLRATQTMYSGSRMIHCIFRSATVGGCTRTFWKPSEASSHYRKDHCIAILQQHPFVTCPRCKAYLSTDKSAQKHLRQHITEDQLMIRRLDEEVLGNDDELARLEEQRNL